MNKIVGINNENYIDTLLSKKIVSFKINKPSTTDKIFNGKPSDILHTGDIVYFVTKNIQHKKLAWSI